MNLSFNRSLTRKLHSTSQQVRVMSEDWYQKNAYCLACPSPRLAQTPANSKVVDFLCERCGAGYQLKAKEGRFGPRIRDGAFASMHNAVISGHSPHLALLEYRSEDWRVRSLRLVPSHTLTVEAVEKCPPLSPSARRAGWVGCNIRLDLLAPETAVFVVREGRVESPELARAQWQRFQWLEERSVADRNWLHLVLGCIRRLGKSRFSLAEVYSFEPELAAHYPQNRNVRAKIRQQLQQLRDYGLLRFIERGCYELKSAPTADAR